MVSLLSLSLSILYIYIYMHRETKVFVHTTIQYLYVFVNSICLAEKSLGGYYQKSTQLDLGLHIIGISEKIHYHSSPIRLEQTTNNLCPTNILKK